MAAGVTYQFIVVVSLKSMGAPCLAPLGPFTFSNKDILATGHALESGKTTGLSRGSG